MNLSEINWDFNAAGTWPLPIKIAAILITGAAVMGVGVYYDTLDQMALLEGSEKKELELKQSFENKQKKAVNLQDYQEQLAQIETSLGEMIKQMPTQEEVASLLVDISQTGLASGLEFRLFKPSAPVRKDFYFELPITIEVIGKFEELGLFVSGLASLPRIVTVHDVEITPVKAEVTNANDKDKESKESKDIKDGAMVMKAIVKTYNEGEDTEAGATKKKRGHQ